MKITSFRAADRPPAAQPGGSTWEKTSDHARPGSSCGTQSVTAGCRPGRASTSGNTTARGRTPAAGFAYGTSRTAEKLERAKQFGLSESIAVGNDPSSLADAVRKWTNSVGVNVILDLVGAAYLKSNLDSLATLGRLIFVGTTSGARAEIDYGIVMRKRLRVMGTSLRTRSIEEKATATRLFAQHVVPLFANGSVRGVIDSVYRIAEVREAHKRIESNETFGKVVLTID